MWEVSEMILHHVKCDVLVIFDCCDTGSLASLRSPGRAFEYLGACDKDKYTNLPGKNSFTSALTWALKELRSEAPFTTADLLAKINCHRWFPSQQKPVLFSRNDFPEHIWISGMGNLTTTTAIRRSSSSSSGLEFRDENCDFVDVRVTFSRRLSDEDGKVVAEMMEPLVRNTKLPLNARHVSFIKKGKCTNHIELWKRTLNYVIASQRFQRSFDMSDNRPDQKRQRISFDSDAEDSSPTKHRKLSVEMDSEHESQLPTQLTTVKEPYSLVMGSTVEPTLDLLESPVTLEGDDMDQTEQLLRVLDRLRKEITTGTGITADSVVAIRASLDMLKG
jgi:hypothetical protein